MEERNEKKTTNKKLPNPITEIQWIYAQDSLGRQLSELKCKLNDLSSNIEALTYLHKHSQFNDGKLKRKTKKRKMTINILTTTAFVISITSLVSIVSFVVWEKLKERQ